MTQTVVVLTTGSSWVVPAGVTSLDLVEVWGAGGSGAKGSHGTGGGGGAWASIANLAVTAGATIAYSLGVGGAAISTGSTAGQPGGDTWFSSSSTVLAKGGGAGQTATTGNVSGGTGGLASASIGSAANDGGAGGNVSSSSSASGGGSSATATGIGGAAANITTNNTAGAGGSAPGGGAGGAALTAGTSNTEGGGGGGASITSATAAGAGGLPGGGGGGVNGGTPSGAGGAGQIRITYTANLGAGVAASTSASASLTTATALRASPASVSSASGNLVGRTRFVAAAALSTSASAALSKPPQVIRGSAAAATSASGALTVRTRFAVAARVSVSVAAPLTTRQPIRGSATASITAHPALTALRPIAAAATVAVSAAAALATRQPVRGAAPAGSAAAASLVTGIQLAGNAPLSTLGRLNPGPMAAATATGSSVYGGLYSRVLLPAKNRLLARLNRVFDKSPWSVLALRIQSAGGLTWSIAGRYLIVNRPATPQLVVSLEGLRISDLRDQLAGDGISILYYAVDPAILALDAMTLLDGSGDQDQSNGDHIFAYTNKLWAWTDAVGRWLDYARADLRAMLLELFLPASDGDWSDLWASYFNVLRRAGESDQSQNFRTAYEWRRPRSNPVAIARNVQQLLGANVAVREPWKEMWTLDQSALSGGDHMPNATEYSYHTAQLTSRDFVNWPAITVEAEADRPAGTLFLGPVTLPYPWVVDCETGLAFVFSATTTETQFIRDYDGMILSYNASLSNSFVLPGPRLSITGDSFYTSQPLANPPNSMGKPRTYCVGEITLSEAPPMGDLQGHFGGRMRVETGAPMVLSGADSLSDYLWAAPFGPIDVWLAADDALAFAAPITYPAQSVIGVGTGIIEWLSAVSADPGRFSISASSSTISAGSGVVTANSLTGQSGGSVDANTTSVDANSDANDANAADTINQRSVAADAITRFAMPVPGIYDLGWHGRWDGRTWTAAGYPSPLFALTVTTHYFGSHVALSTSAAGVLATQIQLAGAAAASSSADSPLTGGYHWALSTAASSAVSAVLTTKSQLVSDSRQVTVTATAAMRTGAGLSGAANVAASVAAPLATSIPLAAAVTTDSAANLIAGFSMRSGARALTFVASGTLGASQVPLAGAATARVNVNGTLATGIALAGHPSVVVSKAASLNTGIRLAGRSSVVLAPSAALTTFSGPPPLNTSIAPVARYVAAQQGLTAGSSVATLQDSGPHGYDATASPTQPKVVTGNRGILAVRTVGGSSWFNFPSQTGRLQQGGALQPAGTAMAICFSVDSVPAGDAGIWGAGQSNADRNISLLLSGGRFVGSVYGDATNSGSAATATGPSPTTVGHVYTVVLVTDVVPSGGINLNRPALYVDGTKYTVDPFTGHVDQGDTSVSTLGKSQGSSGGTTPVSVRIYDVAFWDTWLSDTDCHAAAAALAAAYQ